MYCGLGIMNHDNMQLMFMHLQHINIQMLLLIIAHFIQLLAESEFDNLQLKLNSSLLLHNYAVT